MPVERFAPTLRGPTLSAQRWTDLGLLHWPVDPERVSRFFPAGTRPDVRDGTTYVGLVPFRMRGAGPWRLPAPYFGTFYETNVRLYSVDESGHHGIVFLTLEAARLATVVLARLSLGLPYTWARMTSQRSGDRIDYRSRRRWPGATTRAGGRIALRIGDPVQPSDLEVWLTSRWGLHTRVAGRTVWVPNQHEPWPLHAAEILHLDCDLVSACGVSTDGVEPLRALWTPGVHTTFGLPALVSPARSGRRSNS